MVKTHQRLTQIANNIIHNAIRRKETQYPTIKLHLGQYINNILSDEEVNKLRLVKRDGSEFKSTKGKNEYKNSIREFRDYRDTLANALFTVETAIRVEGVDKNIYTTLSDELRPIVFDCTRISSTRKSLSFTPSMKEKTTDCINKHLEQHRGATTQQQGAESNGYPEAIAGPSQQNPIEEQKQALWNLMDKFSPSNNNSKEIIARIQELGDVNASYKREPLFVKAIQIFSIDVIDFLLTHPNINLGVEFGQHENLVSYASAELDKKEHSPEIDALKKLLKSNRYEPQSEARPHLESSSSTQPSSSSRTPKASSSAADERIINLENLWRMVDQSSSKGSYIPDTLRFLKKRLGNNTDVQYNGQPLFAKAVEAGNAGIIHYLLDPNNNTNLSVEYQGHPNLISYAFANLDNITSLSAKTGIKKRLERLRSEYGYEIASPHNVGSSLPDSPEMQKSSGELQKMEQFIYNKFGPVTEVTSFNINNLAQKKDKIDIRNYYKVLANFAKVSADLYDMNEQLQQNLMKLEAFNIPDSFSETESQHVAKALEVRRVAALSQQKNVASALEKVERNITTLQIEFTRKTDSRAGLAERCINASKTARQEQVLLTRDYLSALEQGNESPASTEAFTNRLHELSQKSKQAGDISRTAQALQKHWTQSPFCTGKEFKGHKERLKAFLKDASNSHER